jgi:hypothetical protein
MRAAGTIMISRIACFILAAHLFNLSIDPRDPGPAFAPDNLAHNDIETFAEFMAEVVLGMTGAFAEHEESDDHGQTIHLYKYVSPSPVTCLQSVSPPERASVFCNLSIGITQSPLTKITAPPPRWLV